MKNEQEWQSLKEQARALRRQGLSIERIGVELHLSGSRVKQWVSDIPGPPRGPRPGAPRKPARVPYVRSPEGERRRAQAFRAYQERERAAREARRQAISAAAASEIGELSQRELLIAGALAYWCEGSKSKPYRRSDRVVFFNSDPELISFFLRFLGVAGVPRDSLRFSVSIHESADVPAAERFWQELTGAGQSQFTKAALKHHAPKTTWDNIGSTYRGCLRIDVHRSRDLYRKIEGWVAAATLADWPALPASEPKDLPALEMT